MGFNLRLFAIWNKNYKIAWVTAANLDDALAMATSTGHMFRATGYRKWRDCTDEIPEDLPALAKDLLDRQEAGVVTTFPPNPEWRIAT